MGREKFPQRVPEMGRLIDPAERDHGGMRHREQTMPVMLLREF
jgi:hypothetical protein